MAQQKLCKITLKFPWNSDDEFHFIASGFCAKLLGFMGNAIKLYIYCVGQSVQKLLP